MANKRIIVAAGGTGGHLFPAQAFAEECLQHASPPQILFVAAGLRGNRCFDKQAFSFQEITSSPLILRNPIKVLKGIGHLCKGFYQSLTILKKYRPAVVVGFGSYYTLPVVLAAKWLNIPIVLHEANSIPGKANQWLSPLATYVGIHFPTSAPFFKGKAIEVSLPLRKEYRLGMINKKMALDYYGFSSQSPTLLICGGSQGASSINRIIKECMPSIKKLDVQVIHITGNDDTMDTLSSLYASHRIRAQVKPFENHMNMAWTAADACISRAGASTIAEAIEFEVPMILIPYPHAHQHQEKNADFFTDTIQGGWKLLETKLTAKYLGEKIAFLFSHDQLIAFKKEIQSYKKQSKQLSLCEFILNL